MPSKDAPNKIVIFFVKNMKDLKENLEKRLFKFRNIRNGAMADDMREHLLSDDSGKVSGESSESKEDDNNEMTKNFQSSSTNLQEQINPGSSSTESGEMGENGGQDKSDSKETTFNRPGLNSDSESGKMEENGGQDKSDSKETTFNGPELKSDSDERREDSKEQTSVLQNGLTLADNPTEQDNHSGDDSNDDNEGDVNQMKNSNTGSTIKQIDQNDDDLEKDTNNDTQMSDDIQMSDDVKELKTNTDDGPVDEQD